MANPKRRDQQPRPTQLEMEKINFNLSIKTAPFLIKITAPSYKSRTASFLNLQGKPPFVNNREILNDNFNISN